MVYSGDKRNVLLVAQWVLRQFLWHSLTAEREGERGGGGREGERERERDADGRITGKCGL